MMYLRIILLFVFFVILASAGYFAFVQGLIPWLPDITGPDSSRASEREVDGVVLDLIPGPDDWIDYGPILEKGSEGEWDFSFAGITPASLIKKDGTFYLYYGGANGYRSFDGGPRHRSIGVATSEDGINYQKYEGNPIMTHSPLSHEEEGANSAGITLDQQGNFIMYYGAAIGETDTTINANGRLAVSRDGFNFTDQGIVMNRLNPFLYGFGDEIFPVAAFQHNGRWNVYYQPNGALNERTLGMVWGSRMDRLTRSTGVMDERSGGAPVISWGNIIWLSPDRIALFIQRLWWPDTFIEVRTASPDAPHRLSEPVVRYDIPNLKHGTAFLDEDRRTWFMVYNNFDSYWRLKLAPAGEPDTTPPTQPGSLRAEVLDYDKVRLSWDPANDPDTGVVIYRIYREGVEVGSTKELSFTEFDLSELTSYTYEVSAVNFHGYEGHREAVSVKTLGDHTSPQLVSASTHGDTTQLLVEFSKPVDKTSAEDTDNYYINSGVEVYEAVLQADLITVRLSTSAQQEGAVYTLEVDNILDRAAAPNKVEADSRIHYIHSSIAGLVGYWSLDEGAGDTAHDYSGFGNHAIIEGARWQTGHKGGALSFDGIHDYVLIKDSPSLTYLSHSSFTFSVWVRPVDRPEGRNPYSVLTRVIARPYYYLGLSYDREGKYRAQVISSEEEFYVLASSTVDPDTWHHLAMVVDMDSSLLHLYVNGEPVNDSPMRFSGKLMGFRESDWESDLLEEYFIGSIKPEQKAGSFFNHQFNGLIDEISIYSQALGAEEIYCLAKQCK